MQDKPTTTGSNNAPPIDLERPITKISRSHHDMTLNISVTVRGRIIVTMDYKQGLTHARLKNVISNELE